jgi:hypothetical protein
MPRWFPVRAYQPGFQNQNLGLFKAFPITDRYGFQFRAEAFNFINYPNWWRKRLQRNNQHWAEPDEPQYIRKSAHQGRRRAQCCSSHYASIFKTIGIYKGCANGATWIVWFTRGANLLPELPRFSFFRTSC